MDLVRWDPFRELEEMSERLNRVFRRPLPRTSGAEEAIVAADWAPVVDVVESDREYLIKAELPEVKKQDLKVAIRDGVLCLQGKREQEKEEKGEKFHRIERSYGAFARHFSVPQDADEEKVSAGFEDGVLSIHLPKSETAKPKSLQVSIT
jgi:HSP20 family protein